MATAYTSLLGLALPVTGELQGSWGDTVNTAITSLLDTAVAGTTSITTDADVTLSTTTGVANQARQAIVLWNPASGTTTRNITAPAQSKIYTVINASGGTQSIVFRGAGPTTGVTIVKGESAVVAWNGTDFIKVSNTAGGGSFTTLTASGTVTFTGLAASQAVFTDASDNLVSNAITGTGNVVMSASPTLTGTITAAAITASGTVTGNGNWVLGNADTDTITQGAAYVTGTALRSAKLATNTLALAAYDVDGAAYTNLITLTAANAPTLALTSTGVGTINNMSIGATTASTGAFTTLSATGVSTFQAGTAAAPAITTTGDLNTGIFFPAADTIAFAEGGVESMRLDASGNLGIGTSSPGTKLDVAGTARVQSSFFVYGTGDRLNVFPQTAGSGVQILVTNNANSAYAPLSLEGSLQSFNISGAEQMRLTSTGLGIGTSSPVTPLDVVSNSSANAITIRARGLNDYSFLTFRQNNGTEDLGGLANLRTAANTGSLLFYTANGGGAAERARIDSSGNLLVGTTVSAGAGKLTVAGGINSVNGALNVAGNGGFYNSSNKFGVDNNAGASRLYSSGPNSSTRGSFEFHITDSVGSLDTTAMTLDASGNLLVGATSTLNGNKLFVAGTTLVAGINVLNGTGEAYRFYSNGAAVGSITVTGSTTTYNTFSDYRLKNTIAPMTGALDKVALLKPCTYKWKADGSDGQGFIAHELAEVEPGCVTGEKDAVDAEGKPQYQGIDTSFLVATLTAAIQEQQAIITALTARVAALESN